MMTITEAAEWFGVSRPTIYKWIAKGKVKAEKVDGKWAIPREGQDMVERVERGPDEPEAPAPDPSSLMGRLLVHEGISWRAKGLACAIHLFPERFADGGVKEKNKRLAAVGKDGWSGVETALKELRRAGILRWERIRHEGMGATKGYRWYLCLD